MGLIHVRCRRSSGTAIFQPRRSTLTSPTSTCGKLTIDFIPAPGLGAAAKPNDPPIHTKRHETSNPECRSSLVDFMSTSTSAIEVTRTYLEMRDSAELQPARSNDPLIR